MSGQERLVTDAEVLQEILHRYVSIARSDAIQPAFDALLGLLMKCSRWTVRPLNGPKRSCSAGMGCRREMRCTLQ